MTPQSPSASQLARHAFRSEGVRGLYRGLPGIWAKEVPGSFIYLGSYECAKASMRHLNETPQLSKSHHGRGGGKKGFSGKLVNMHALGTLVESNMVFMEVMGKGG